MKTTRRRILEYLALKRAVTVGEIATALHITPADIRHHLATLQAESIVEKVGSRPPAAKGRPAGLYGLVEQFEEHNFARLAASLLAAWLESTPEPAAKAAGLQRLADMLAGAATAAERSPRGQVLLQAVRLLNEQHYQARWEAHAAAPRLIFEHCPYAAILAEHPELCELDARLVQNLLGGHPELTACRELTRSGTRQCVFVLKS
jgi:predicted ArsR family transcriptional regulator